ncbi:MAG: zinc-ribbon domain-containing protein [Syntrophobacterales bacterium]|nr:zinc-ribbon domain-containing protein [Syntrophobacterales bacterium]
MIIQCKKCGTKYRFDKSQIDGEGIWVRCSHCDAVFFQENPLTEIVLSTGSAGPEEGIHEKAHEKNAEDIDRIFMEVEAENDVRNEQEEDDGDIGEIIGNAKASKKEAQKPRSPGKKTAIFLILVILLSGGIYLWTSPRAVEGILNRILPQVEKFIGILPGVEKLIGTKNKDISDECLSGLGVDLINVKERFVKNWVAGDIMVIEGFAVNNNKCAVSDIRVKGKILDSSGDILAEEESNCGNILTDDELKGLTDKEIVKELSNPYGREFSNADIEPGANIPFMLAFIMPAGKASEFLVELAGIKAVNSK